MAGCGCGLHSLLKVQLKKRTFVQVSNPGVHYGRSLWSAKEAWGLPLLDSLGCIPVGWETISAAPILEEAALCGGCRAHTNPLIALAIRGSTTCVV